MNASRWLCLVSACIALRAQAADLTLPIYIEDNHAGSFHWLAQRLDLEEPHTLILFDAHSDASGIFDSDLIRERIRRVASIVDRQAVLDAWRRDGTIQCFDWIEPLMPAPFANVIWVPGERLPSNEKKLREREAREFLDGHLEAAPRATGSFRERYRVSDFEALRRTWRDGPPLVVSIDLDSFAGLPTERQQAAFDRIWRWTVERRNLRAVTISISRLFLKDDAEAHRLLELALRAALSLPTASVQFEPHAIIANDRSELAKRLRASSREVPAYDVTQAPETLRSLLLAQRNRLLVRHQPERFKQILDGWVAEAPHYALGLKDREPSTDGVWRIQESESATLELMAKPWYAEAGQVEWIVLTPTYPSCNLVAMNAEFLGFAADAPPRPRWTETLLRSAGPSLDLASLRPFFDRSTGLGSVRVKARVRTGATIRETEEIEIRRGKGTGFQSAVLESFGLPYLLGGGELRIEADTGPETRQGADCANFVIAALRRTGHRIPWSDPKGLRARLDLLGTKVRIGQARIDEAMIESGVIIHLGTHVAAVIEDRPPLGVLDANDLIAHQLEGKPELISLGQLLRTRTREDFDLYRAPAARDTATVLFGGDVMLARSVGDSIRAGDNPLAEIAGVLTGADLAMANLECVISDAGAPKADARYIFRAPPEAAAALRQAGFAAVSLANNHTLDFGPRALADTQAHLTAAGVTPLGAGSTSDEAAAARKFRLPNGAKVAVLAIDAVSSPGPDATTGFIASATFRQPFAEAISQARSDSAAVFCLVHWGDENSRRTTTEQREFARWLIDHGVDAVIGSHPHCVQPVDSYHGCLIFYSLGNLVFDGGPTLPDWNAGNLVELSVSLRGVEPSYRIIPVQLDERGHPAVAAQPGRELTIKESRP